VFPPSKSEEDRAASPSVTGLDAALAVGRADDPLEDDAHHVAQHALTSSDAERSAAAPPSRTTHAAPPGESGPRESQASVHQVLRSPGLPLDADTRTFFEHRLGRDLAGVRIHADDSAAASAGLLGAPAYTAGTDIAFGAGRYQPTTRAGQRLLAHELVHVAQFTSSHSAPLIVRRAPPDGPSVQVDADWPDWAGQPKLSVEQNHVISHILAKRADIVIRPDLVRVEEKAKPGSRPHDPTYKPGYRYAGKRGKLDANASRYLKIAMNEYWATEGGVASINTWDTPFKQSTQNFTLGPGILNQAAVSNMRKWITADPVVAEFFRSTLGVWVTQSVELRVVVGSDDIRAGDEAREFLNDPHILSGIMNIAEQGHGEALDKAEQDWVTRIELPKIPTEVAAWDDAAIACCLHIQHGASAWSWIYFKSQYLATNGDPLEIAKVFAVITAQKKIFRRLGNATTGPILVTIQWGQLVYKTFERWGIGGGKPGYLKQAIDAKGTRVSGTPADLGADPQLAGHILYKTGDAGKEVVALDIGPPTAATP
jgi:hypothetical protein